MIDFKKEIAEIIAKNLEGLTEDEIKSMVEIPQDQSMGCLLYTSDAADEL